VPAAYRACADSDDPEMCVANVAYFALMSAGNSAMQGNIGQRRSACHGDRVGEQPDVSIDDDYIAQDGW